MGSGAQAQWLRRLDLVAPSHVESSQVIDRRIIDHWTTREVLVFFFKWLKSINNT